MVEDSNEEVGKDKAKFNMALDTLQRLGLILKEIKSLQQNINLTDADKQKQKIYLTKHFFIQASPLLPEDVVKDRRDKILNLLPAMRKLYTKIPGSADRYEGYQFVFDPALDSELDIILIELQQILQENKYFMPPADDEGMF